MGQNPGTVLGTRNSISVIQPYSVINGGDKTGSMELTHLGLPFSDETGTTVRIKKKKLVTH
jgi:hypothetical protein